MIFIFFSQFIQHNQIFVKWFCLFIYIFFHQIFQSVFNLFFTIVWFLLRLYIDYYYQSTMFKWFFSVYSTSTNDYICWNIDTPYTCPNIHDVDDEDNKISGTGSCYFWWLFIYPSKDCFFLIIYPFIQSINQSIMSVAP